MKITFLQNKTEVIENTSGSATTYKNIETNDPPATCNKITLKIVPNGLLQNSMVNWIEWCILLLWDTIIIDAYHLSAEWRCTPSCFTLMDKYFCGEIKYVTKLTIIMLPLTIALIYIIMLHLLKHQEWLKGITSFIEKSCHLSMSRWISIHLVYYM